MKRTMIDPPMGWKYGFPRMLPPRDTELNLREWFIAKGYPEEHVELALKYSRYWEVDDPDIEDVATLSNN